MYEPFVLIRGKMQQLLLSSLSSFVDFYFQIIIFGYQNKSTINTIPHNNEPWSTDWKRMAIATINREQTKKNDYHSVFNLFYD